MTDPISAAEAAAANAIDANLTAEGAAQSIAAAPATPAAEANSDLLGDNPTEAQVEAAEGHARQLEAQLAAIKAAKAAKNGTAIPHGVPHIVPAAIVPKATDTSVVHMVAEKAVQSVPEKISGTTPLESTPVALSAKIQAAYAAGWKPTRYKAKRK